MNEPLIEAITQAKAKFSEFFKLANAGNTKAAGMCVFDAEMILTKAVIDARAALAAQPGAVGEANTELRAHMRLLNEYVEACNAGNTKTHMKAADAARQKVEASALSLISAKDRSEPDCAGGMPCTDCPDKRKCQAGCVKQEEALKRPDQKSAQRHPLDVQALYELQTVMADFGGDWSDVPGEQEVVRRAKMLSRLWKSESTTEVVGVNGRQRMLLAQAWTMLEDYAEGNRRAGNDSFADGAIASAHEIKLMLAAAPTEAKPATQQASGEREAWKLETVLAAAREWSAERMPSDWCEADLMKAIIDLEGDWPGCDECDHQCDEPCVPVTVAEMHARIDNHIADLVHAGKLGAYIGYTPPAGWTPTIRIKRDRAALSKPAQDAVDAELLDWLEAQINEHGAIHLHDGNNPNGHGLGLRHGSLNRTLRDAIRAAISAKKGQP